MVDGEKAMTVEEADLRAIVRLLSEVAALPAGLLGKKCYILDGICEFAGASEWRWGIFSRQRQSPITLVIRRLGDISFPTPISDVATPHSAGGIRFLPETPKRNILVSHRLLESGKESRIALCRKGDAKPFSSRESRLAALVLDEIPWLHWRNWAPAPFAQKLSPRQRLTLDLLLVGLGRKEIAAQLGIAPGTVSGYVRELYRLFAVKSQAELMRLHF